MHRSIRISAICGLLATLTFGGGCFIAADAVNPSIFAAFGLDPGSITRPPGTVVVSLNNTTNFDAVFFVGYATDTGATTTTLGTDDEVNANSQVNRVFACPVSLLRPGQFGLADANEAVVVFANNAAVAVAYAGQPLQTGDFRCGDLIEIRLEQVGAGGDAPAFQIRVVVRPGR